LMNAKISVTRTAASLLLCLSLALPLAACGSSSSSQKTSTSDFEAKMASAYTAVLDDVDNGNYDFTNANSKFEMTPVTDGSKAIQYALQDIDGDGHPELLVRQPQTTSSEPTIQWNTLFFTYKSGKTAKALDGVVTLPSSTSARTAETSLYARDGGKGAYKRVYDASVSGDASDPKKDNTISYASITVDGDTIAEKDLSSTSTPKDIGKKIAFTDISDRSALDKLAGKSGDTASSNSASKAKSSTKSKSSTTTSKATSAKDRYDQAVANSGGSVWQGTLRIVSDQEMTQLQVDLGEISQSEYSGLTSQFSSAQNVVLVFNQATTVTGESADGSGTTESKTQRLVKLNGSGWSAYAGKHVAVKVPAASAVTFPTDTRLPIGDAAADISASDALVASY
jgi:hypothetical protein